MEYYILDSENYEWFSNPDILACQDWLDEFTIRVGSENRMLDEVCDFMRAEDGSYLTFELKAR